MAKENDTTTEAARALIAGLAQSFNGLLDKVPADYRPALAGIKERIDAALAKLPPTDQVPAAGQAAASLNWVAEVLTHLNGLWVETTGQLRKMTEQYESQATSLNRLAGLEADLTGGKLLTVEQARELQGVAVQEAVAEALKTERAEQARRIQRQEALRTAGLADAPEAVLGIAEDEAFSAALTAAQGRKTALEGLGLSLNTFPGAAWSDEDLDRVKRVAAELAKRPASTGAAFVPKPGAAAVPELKVLV